MAEHEWVGPGRAHSEELVFTETMDGIPLAGMVAQPADGRAAATAVVWIHGSVSHFYERSHVFLGRELAQRGVCFLSGNTRGHDAAALLWRGGGSTDLEVVPGGSAWERLDESPRDIAAWLDVATSLGFERIALGGHSLGASKVAYYQARHNDPRINGLIAAFPTLRWPSLPDRLALAEQMVAEGRGEDLLPHLEGSPAWNIVSAQTAVTREGVVRHAFDAASGDPHISFVRCPILVLHGTREEREGGELETLRLHAREAPSVDMQPIDGAGHDYAGYEGVAATVIARWLQKR